LAVINWQATFIVLTYLLLNVFIGIWISYRRTHTVSDFTVASRRMGGITLFFTLLATIVGAASVVGYTGWYYIRGISQLWFTIGITISYIVYIYYLGPRIHQFGANKGGETVGDWMEYRYGPLCRYIASILLIVAYLAITAFQYMAMATVFNQVTGLSYNLSLFVSSLVIIVIASWGGLWAVGITDVIQGFLTIVGIIIMAPIFVHRAGGIGRVFSSVPPEHLQFFGHVNLSTAISFSLVFLLGIISWPDIWQRCYAARDVKTLKKSMTSYAVANLILCGGLMLLIGFSARILYPNYEYPESILPFMVMDQMPGIVGSLFMAVLLAVILGTGNSTLLVCPIMFVKDIYSKFKPDITDEHMLRINKSMTVVFGLLVLVLAYTAPSMFDIWVWSADITGATLAVPILLGMAWQRPSNSAALVSIAMGFIGWALAQAGLVGLSPILLGGLMSLVGYLVIALIHPRESRV